MSLCGVSALALGAPVLDRLERPLATCVDMHAPQLPVLGLERPEDVHLDVDPAPGAPRHLVRVDEDAVVADRLYDARIDPELLPCLQPLGAPLHEALVAPEVSA